MKIRYVLLLIIFYAQVSYSESYVCIADYSTGFSYNDKSKEWAQSNFNVNRSKYVVKMNVDSKEWEVTPIGENISLTYCERGFSKAGSIRCSGMPGFRMNNKNLRFMAVHEGYWIDNIPETGRPDGANTPAIEIGKCSKI